MRPTAARRSLTYVDPFRTPDEITIGSATGITSVEKLGDIDTLVWEGARLIVRSPRAMPSWRVGKNRKTAVHFRGVRYVIVAERMEQAQYEYVLDPWPPRAHELPSQEIAYDEQYVHDREDYARALTVRRGETLALAPLWPLFGVLPSPVKRVLHERYGFSPLTMTRFSVVIELAFLPFFFIALIMPSAFVLFTFIALFADAFFRVSILFDESYPAFGFFEWIVRPGLATTVSKGWSAIRARVRGRRD